MQPIRFEPLQRAELLQLGLVPVAIEALETEGLPEAKSLLVRRPPSAAVLDELQAVTDALNLAHRAIERLLGAKATVPHLRAARSAISGGGLRHSFGGLEAQRNVEVVDNGHRSLDDSNLDHSRRSCPAQGGGCRTCKPHSYGIAARLHLRRHGAPVASAEAECITDQRVSTTDWYLLRGDRSLNT